MSEAGEDQHVFAAKVAADDGLAILIDQREGSTDHGRACGFDLVALRAARDDKRGRASERDNEKPGKDNDEESAALLFSQLQQSAVDTRACDEAAKGKIANAEVHGVQ